MRTLHDSPDAALSALRRAAIVALEALEVDDPRQAVEVLLSALEDGPPPSGWPCPECGLQCGFPGRVEDHVRNVHGLELRRAA